MRARVVTRDPFYEIKKAIQKLGRDMGKQAKAAQTPTHPVYHPDEPLDAIDTQIAFFGAKPGDPGATPYYYWNGAWHPFGAAIGWAIAFVEYDLTGAGAGTLAPYGDEGADANLFLTNNEDLFEIDVDNSGIKVNAPGAFDILSSSRVLSNTAGAGDAAGIGIAETTNEVEEGPTSLNCGMPTVNRSMAAGAAPYQFRPNVIRFSVFSDTDTIPVTLGTYLDYTEAGTWSGTRATLLVKTAGSAVAGALP